MGVDVTSTDTSGIAAAVAVAKAADVVVLTVGISGAVEAEGHDRETTTLPGAQPELISAILALNKPTVLVLIHGGAMSLGPLKDASPAILDVFYGGEEAANAMASVIFGEYNPSGKWIPHYRLAASFIGEGQSNLLVESDCFCCDSNKSFHFRKIEHVSLLSISRLWLTF